MTQAQALKPAAELAAKASRPFPNDSEAHRVAGTALLAEEIELRRYIERIAALRRALPPGGEAPQEYEFTAEDGMRVRLSELFGDRDTLVTYFWMYSPERERPCPGGHGLAIDHRAGVGLPGRSGDSGADFGFGAVGPPRSSGHGSVRRLLAVDAGHEAVIGHEGFVRGGSIGRVRIYGRGRVALVEQALAQSASFVSGSICPFSDEAEAAVDGDVVTVAKGRDRQIDPRQRAVLTGFGLGELHRPARIAVLVPQLGRLVVPVMRHLAGLDGVLLGLCVALARRLHQVASTI